MDEDNSSSGDSNRSMSGALKKHAKLAYADRAMAARFDSRVIISLKAMTFVHVIFLVMDALMGNLDEFWAWNAGMLACAAAVVFTTRDGLKAFIFSHVCWTFSFATYLYAYGNLRPVRLGLEAATLSASIAFVSQLALLAAHFCTKQVNITVSPKTQSKTLTALVPLSAPLACVGLTSVIADYFDLIDPIFIFTLRLFLFFALGLRLIQKRSKFYYDYVVIISAVLIAVQSVSSNVRSDIFGLLLFLGFIALLVSRTLVTPAKAIAAITAWRLMSVFSMISLSARADQWLTGGGGAGSIAIARLFSLDAVSAFFNPFARPAFYQQVDSAVNPMRSSFFVSGDGITDRLVLLPYMDKFLALIGRTEGFRLNEVWNLILSILPSVGQQKDIILSDRLSWETGARVVGNIGRPLLTAEAELFVIGGYIFVFLFIFLTFLTQYEMFRLTVIATRSKTISILFFSQLFVNTIFSTTALSVAMGTIRAPAQTLIVLFLIKGIALEVQRRGSRNRTAPLYAH